MSSLYCQCLVSLEQSELNYDLLQAAGNAMAAFVNKVDHSDVGICVVCCTLSMPRSLTHRKMRDKCSKLSSLFQTQGCKIMNNFD